MVSHLIFMRHAKSLWDDATLSDHARPLSPKGRKDAANIAAELARRDILVNQIWASDSNRTRETGDILMHALPGAQSLHHTYEFYQADTTAVMRFCNNQDEPQGGLIILGHNPAWSELYQFFSGQIHDFPPGSCAVFTRKGKAPEEHWFSADMWESLALILPKDLR